MKTVHTLAAAAFAAIAIAPAAHAGTPVTIGEGTAPSLAVDGDGAANVVWANSTAKSLTYCKVPRGATACATTRALTVPDVSGAPDDAFIQRIGATLVVSMPIYATDKTYTWTSGDNGATWSAPGLVYGAVNQLPDATLPSVPLPGFTGLVYMSGGKVWRSDGAGDAAQTEHATLGDDGIIDYDFQVARVGAGNGMIAVANDLASSRVWVTNGGDPRKQASWGAPAAVGAVDTTRLAYGPSGTFLFGSSGATQVIRKWNTTTNAFDAPVVLAPETGYINDVTVGASGAVAAIWRRNEPFGGNRLQLALSTTGNAPYAVSTVAREDAVMAGMRVGIAPDARGFAVFEGKGAGGATAPIRITDLTPVAVPLPVKPPVTPPVTAKPTKAKTVSVPGAKITFTTPNGCVAAGKSFKVKLTWKKAKKKGNVFVKVRRADFYIDKKRVKVDKKAPFVQVLKIAKPVKGKTYKLKARAFIKVKKGKSPTKSISTTVKVCS